MNAKEFLAEKGVFNLDTKKRYNEVIDWMEEYAALRQPPVIGSVCTCIAFHKSDECYKLGCKVHRIDNVQTVL
jgi:hypothetical protein